MIILLQMVTLYKDPQGQTVMTVNEALSRDRSGTIPKQNDELIKLRKRIQDLETTISRYKVALQYQSSWLQ